MSTYWGYFCQDCNQGSDHWLNHGEETLVQLVEVLTLLDKKFPLVEISPADVSWCASEIRIFLDEHWGHSIALQNEYGKLKTFGEVKKELE